MAKKKAAKKAPKKAAAKRVKTSTKQTARDPVGAPTQEQIQASFDGGKSYSATAYRELIGW